MAGVLSNTIFGIGAVATTYMAFKVLSFVRFYFFLPPAMHSYTVLPPGAKDDGHNAPYAVVTGASAGIGYALALNLAAIYGFNIVLIGHLADELADAAARIERAAPGRAVRVVVLDATQGSYADIETAIRTHGLAALPISALFNNVGGLGSPALFPEKFRPFHAYAAPAQIDSVFDINVRFGVYLTHALLPHLAARAPLRSLVVNTSSGAEPGIPFQLLYAACKAFVSSFSNGLEQELRAVGMRSVDVVAVVPGEVQSAGYRPDLGPLVPTADRFAKEMLRIVGPGRGRHVFPFWPHRVAQNVLMSLPQPAFDVLLRIGMEGKKARFDGTDVEGKKIR